jgi:hypothetical protein
MKAENRGQLVRGVVGVSYWRAGFLSTSYKTYAEADDRHNIVAYTPWFRHDDDLSKCEQALRRLVNAYDGMPGTDGCISYGYEYKDYRK